MSRPGGGGLPFGGALAGASAVRHARMNGAHERDGTELGAFQPACPATRQRAGVFGPGRPRADQLQQLIEAEGGETCVIIAAKGAIATLNAACPHGRSGHKEARKRRGKRSESPRKDHGGLRESPVKPSERMAKADGLFRGPSRRCRWPARDRLMPPGAPKSRLARLAGRTLGTSASRAARSSVSLPRLYRHGCASACCQASRDAEGLRGQAS